MCPTRTPYEESSVFSPIQGDLKTAWSVELQPGEVLYVPWHWWHEVRSDETSVSVNVWMESKEDEGEAVLESLVRPICTALHSAAQTPRWMCPSEGSGCEIADCLEQLHVALSRVAPEGEVGEVSLTDLVDALTDREVLELVKTKLLIRKSRQSC
eukprot:TRINITY_DN7615_c0_g1_i1.p1 TRINITY_DN7615_c0_g1~~TRINITY_DN7615_c0_g1_i1.p1  ORF type:complete len:155 (+),score=22.33 TRINITY_DN7615_c0_g1_i1:310-774(+)